MENIIADLLLRHNCVIIPSFGGFVAKPVSARVDFHKGTIQPPSKSILFNSQLINNDGLLISEYAQRRACAYSEAEKDLNEVVADWNQTLRSGRRIEIDRVGMLYLDEEKKVRFEQDRFFNLLLESFGLGAVTFIPEDSAVEHVVDEIKIEATQEAKIVQLQQPVEELNNTKVIQPEFNEAFQIKKKRSAWKYVAAACMLPVMFYAIWIPVKTDVLESGVLSVKDFNPFYRSSKGIYETTALEAAVESENERPDLSDEVNGLEIEYYRYSIDGSNFIAVDLGKNPATESANTEELQDQSFNPASMNFIVGCFGNETNAINLVSKLKSQGFDATIVDYHNGLHRVSAGSALSLEALNQIRDKSEAAGFKGWVLK